MEGTTLSHYRLVEKIGEGGMGVVWKAEDTVLNRVVAIKVLPADFAVDEERRRMFLDEARLAASVSHGNIVQVHELGRDGDLDFIVMEYVEGQPLTNLLRGRPLPPDKVADWGGQVAQGVARAHRKGLMHRDLKPANILITDDGEAKVVDFGLATLFSRTDATAASLATTVTEIAQEKQHNIAGTLPYMSPEQVRGDKLDARSDIFSLGTVLYEMTTGERPFAGPTPAKIAEAILEGQPQPIHELVPAVPLSLDRLVEKLLARKPADRYQGLDDVAVDLKHLARELESGSSPSYEDLHSVSVTRSRRWMPALVTGFAVALLALAGWWTLNRTPSSSMSEPSTANANALAVFSFENLKDPDDPDRLGQILQELVITDLSGLDPLRVLSSQRLFDVQKQLGSKEDRLDKEVSTAVAVEAGAGKMLTGSLSQLGEKWIVAAQMVDVATGEVVQSKRIDGTDLYAMVDRLTAELQKGLRISAPAQVVSVREKTSASIDAYRTYLEGVDHLNNNQYYEAQEKFRAAIEIDPDFGQAHYKLAIATSWPGDNPGAGQKILKKILERELYASDKDRRMVEATLAYDEGHYAKALDSWQALVRDYPDEKEAWYMLGETQWHFPGGQRSEQAMASFQRAVELDPDFLLAYDHIFDGDVRARRYDAALARAEGLIRRDPENARWYQYKAAGLALTVDVADIDAVVNEALAHQRTSAERRELYQLVAGTAWLRGLSAKQEEFYRKALEADPDHDHPTIVRALMDLLRPQARWDEFEEWTRKQLAKEPENEVYLTNILTVHGARNDYRGALAEARRLAREFPERHTWKLEWLSFAIRSGDEAGATTALAAARESAASVEERIWTEDCAARAYRDSGNLNRAMELFRQAMALSTTQGFRTIISERIGGLERSRSRPWEAQRWFQACLDADPEHQGARWGMFNASKDLGDRAEILRTLDAAFALVAPGHHKDTAPAQTALWSGKVAEARREYEQLFARPAPDWEQWNWRRDAAWEFMNAGHPEEVDAICLPALKLPKSKRESGTHYALASSYLMLGRAEDAERVLEEALTVEYPQVVRVLSKLAYCQLALGRPDSAEAFIRRALDLGKVSFGYHALGLAHAARGHYEAARLVAEQCVARDSSRASHELLAWVLVSGDLDLEQGAREARRALSLTHHVGSTNQRLPLWPPAEHSLGLAYLKKKDAQSAVEHLQRAAEAAPKRKSVHRDLARAKALLGTP